jgi:hypothetical protein
MLTLFLYVSHRTEHAFAKEERPQEHEEINSIILFVVVVAGFSHKVFQHYFDVPI